MKKQTTATTVRNPHNLPTKVCAACQRPFTWRKKWERDWENVLYCSDACKRAGKSTTEGATMPAKQA